MEFGLSDPKIEVRVEDIYRSETYIGFLWVVGRRIALRFYRKHCNPSLDSSELIFWVLAIVSNDSSPSNLSTDLRKP